MYVWFSPQNDGVQFCVSSFRRQTMRFLELLQMSMHDIRMMLLSDKPKVIVMFQKCVRVFGVTAVCVYV
jgi:hypothetical protein